MKKLFYFGIVFLILFEILNVYLIMPMPGSQRMNSIDAAYFFHKWRWAFRGLFLAMILIGLFRAHWKRKWLLIIPIALVGVVAFMTNFKMAADQMFRQPEQLILASSSDNKVDPARLVLGVVVNGEAKAYPIQFLGYHHQVQDTVGGKPVLVTYCTVCRTGRAFEPVVNGKHEKFRLVGMDHFNAMFEDETTKSWWRQVNGEGVAGKLKGQRLPEVHSTQTSLSKWLELYPSSLVMQADPAFINTYDSTFKFEDGTSRSSLTGTDSSSWNNKSWVIGVQAGDKTKAYDWNQLKTSRVIHDRIGNTNVVVLLASDNKSFFAFERNNENEFFILRNDTLSIYQRHFSINGRGIDTTATLKPLPAYQEFWHSWKTFNVNTEK